MAEVVHRFERFERTPHEATEVDVDRPLDARPTEVRWEDARSVLTRNASPDLGFDRTVNPYRGCEHGCIYCYARPTHAYLDLSPGLDFETRLVAKRNAAAVLRRELADPAYRPAPVVVGAITDAYQPVERVCRVTREVLEVLCEVRHPFMLVTKSALVERDIDLIGPAAALGLAGVSISVTSLDSELSRILEPRAAAPARRLRTIRTLAQAGIPVHVNVAPVIPFVNEPEIEKVLAAAAEAGATGAFYSVIRLPWEVAPLFRDWLHAHFPDRAGRVMARIREMRGGRDYDPAFGRRMSGDGVWAALIAQRFRRARAGAGLTEPRWRLRNDLFAAPTPAAAMAPLQPSLF